MLRKRYISSPRHTEPSQFHRYHKLRMRHLQSQSSYIHSRAAVAAQSHPRWPVAMPWTLSVGRVVSQSHPQCIPIARLARTSLNVRTPSWGAQCTGDMIERGRYAPIGISARSKPPNFSSIFSKAGQWGTSSSFSPSFTERYPVSPANQTLAPLSVGDPDKIGKICSTAHDTQSDLKRSNNPRPVTCCPGVQVRL